MLEYRDPSCRAVFTMAARVKMFIEKHMRGEPVGSAPLSALPALGSSLRRRRFAVDGCAFQLFIHLLPNSFFSFLACVVLSSLRSASSAGCGRTVKNACGAAIRLF